VITGTVIKANSIDGEITISLHDTGDFSDATVGDFVRKL